MWNTLTWRELKNPEMAADVELLRSEALGVFVKLVAAAYLCWHAVVTVLLSPIEGLPYWALMVVVAPSLAITLYLHRRGSPLAAWWFLLSAVASIVAAVWLIPLSSATALLPIVALVAVVLVNPLAGLVVCALAIAALLLLWQAGPLAFLHFEQLAETSVVSLLTVVAGWVLGRIMLTAVGWSLHSYERALQNAQAAQGHRAQLVQALKQLDTAYYRLERANASLELAWKAAETAERSRAEFVTNISHELRTPLNLIVGFTSMMTTSPESYGDSLPPAYRSDLFAVYRSAQHLLTLTDDVLDLARVGIGRIALARELVDLGQVVDEACDLVRDYVAAKSLWLKVDVQPDVPALSLDRLRVRQVLLNLLTNAARFTEEGGITVQALVEGGDAVVKVGDTGRGMDQGAISRVFDEFYADERGRAREPGIFGGTGLGLPISKRLVELHGGKMGVASVEGVGTTFWFTLPLAATDGVTHSPAWRPSLLRGGFRSGERVLILAGGGEQLAPFLQRHMRGYLVVAAPDVRSAVATATETRPLAILADLDAPEAECRASPVPVVRLPLPHDERIAAELGAAAYLSKPVDRQDLLEAIRRLDRPVRKVLVADDDPGFVDLLTRMLRTRGRRSRYAVVGAHTGREALDLARSHRPDLVLLDLVMPEMGGAAVVAEMAADPELRDTPVILISAQDRSEWQMRIRGEVVVGKPEGFRLEELLDAVEALIGAIDPPRLYLTATDSAPPTA